MTSQSAPHTVVVHGVPGHTAGFPCLQKREPKESFPFNDQASSTVLWRQEGGLNLLGVRLPEKKREMITRGEGMVMWMWCLQLIESFGWRE